MEAIPRLLAAIRAVVRGKDPVVELALVAVLAEGHVLIEDVPGVGKTTLAASVAGALGLGFSRVQFTADLLPADLTGVNVLRDGAFSFRPGPIFAHVVLADELNRTTPRTQSALLEAMEEGKVSVDGETHQLPRPFVVLATRNPWEHYGTYPLPESQLDRFLMQLSLGYPDRESEREILRRSGRGLVNRAVTAEELERMLAAVSEVRVHREVEDLILTLVERSRRDARFLRGVSPRGARALYRAVRALALVRGRDFAVPEDVRELAVPVLAHRVAGRGAQEGEALIRALLDELPAPG
ncbi:MAG: MoxR family ATPase [Deltaproteobacteria bacterium]|nr:MoxR family ATPase [Deltaproteobacteria bacterium]